MADLASLVIKLSADVATLQSDMGKAVTISRSSADQISAAFSKSLGGAADVLKEFAAGLAAAFTVDKIVELGKSVIDLGDNLNKMSQKVGVSVESLSALRNQAALSDVSFEDLGTSMGKLARTAAEAAGGSKQQAAAFQAIGVSVKDANGQLRPMQDILQSVAGKFSEYGDSAAKTALAQQLFGKSGAQLIPLLNELGEKGFGEVVKAAKDYNQVIGAEQAKNSEDFNDNLTRLKSSVTGFASAIVKDMLPGLVAYSGAAADAAKTTDGYASSAHNFATAGKIIVLAVDAARETFVALINIVIGVGDALGAVGDLFSGFAKGVGADLKAIGLAATGDFAGAKAAVAEAGSSIAEGWQTASARVRNAVSATKTGVLDAVSGTAQAYDQLFGAFSNVSSGADTTAKHIRALNAPLVENADAANKAAEAQKQLDAMFAKDAQTISKLTGEQGPVTKNYQQYVAAIVEAQTAYKKEIELAAAAGAGQQAYAQAKQNVIDKTQRAVTALSAENAELLKANDVVGQYLTKIGQDQAEVGMTDRQKAMAEAVAELTDKWQKLNPEIQAYEISMGKLDPTTEAGRAAIEGTTGALYDSRKAFEANQAVIKEWVGIWQTAGDSIASTFSKVLVEGGSLMDGLKDIAKQTVEAIIQYFVKLAVINPILNAIFGGNAGGGGNLLPTLMSAGASLAGGGGASGAASGLGGGGGITDWIGAGKKLWDGFTGGWQSSATSGSTMFGSYSGAFGGIEYGPSAGGSQLGLVPDYANGGGGIGTTVGQGSYSYSPSTLGYATAIAAGVYAGYNRFQASNHDVGGAIGGAAYGVGTAYAAIGVSAALSGGVAAGLAAIPVVGWIALAAMLVDQISGGRLFGTKGKLDSSSQTLAVSGAGANLTQSYTVKGQEAFFGGATFKTTDVAITPEQKAAADAFYKTLTDNSDEFAKAFNTKAGDLIGGSFVQVYDKKGNLKSATTTINGQTYTGETQQQFGERLIAENDIAILKSVGVDITASVKGLISSADDYANAVQDIASALAKGSADITGGMNFLALGSDQTVAALYKLVTGLQSGSETFSQAFARIEQAQAQYTQFTAQFVKPASYTDPFQAAVAQINTNMASAAAQANALARAAGAEGAATKDLTNIHERAAEAFAAAVNQLQMAANASAASLGYALPTSLDQINAEISALGGGATSASSAISGFGTAITDAGQAATDAMQLMLGDLSPLNDQQKLQKALQGQLEGTVTPDQVLQIARRLMGSGSDYAAIFAQVMGVGDRTGHGAASDTGGAASQASSGDPTRLAQLEALRDQIMAAQRVTQAQDLAQQIADLVSSTGETIDEALTNTGITDLGPFLHDLSLSNRQDFDALIASLEKQTDSQGDTTADLSGDIKDGTNVLVDIRTILNLIHSDRALPGTGTPATPNATGVPNRGTSRDAYPVGLGGARA